MKASPVVGLPCKEAATIAMSTTSAYPAFTFDRDASTKHGISSTVITKVDGWQDSSLLIPHEAIRVMLDAFESGLSLDTMEKVEAFAKLWSEWCYDFIHHHHESEHATYPPTPALAHQECSDMPSAFALAVRSRGGDLHAVGQ